MAALSYAVEFFKLFGLARAPEFLWAGVWVAVPLVANMGRFTGWLGRSTEFGAISVGILALPWVGLRNAPFWLLLLALFAVIQLFLRGSAASVWTESLSEMPGRIEAGRRSGPKRSVIVRLRNGFVSARRARPDPPAEVVEVTV
jgi:hypothetical protein